MTSNSGPPPGRAGEAVRRPAVAGLFYPADPLQLRAMVEPMLDKAEQEGRLLLTRDAEEIS